MTKGFAAGIIFALLIAPPAAAQDYEKGLAAKKRGDVAAALKEWRPLAQHGDAAAENAIGLLYDNGEGVTQNHAMALIWYRKAARKGYADAQYNLGMMYANGLGVPQDYAKAVIWYRKAARQGHVEAKADLGVMRLMGRIPGKTGPSETPARPAGEQRSPKPAAPPLAMAENGAQGTEARPAPAKGSDTAKAAPAQPAPAAASVAVKKAAPTPRSAAKASPAPAAGDFRVQLSSVKTKLRAMKEAVRLKRDLESVLGSLEIEPVRADLGPRGVFYRLRAGPLPDFGAARTLCRQLSARNQGCIVIRK